MKKVLLILIISFSLVGIIIRLGYQPFVETFNLKPRAGIKIDSNTKSLVFINNTQLGETPFQNEELKEGDYVVVLKSPPESSNSGQELWNGSVRLNGGTLTVVNRELSDSKLSSAGEIITLEKGKGMTIMSNPADAEVSIDGKVVGRTPLYHPQIEPGEHQFLINRDNYLKRSVRSTIIEGYNLTLSVDLAMTELDLTQTPIIPLNATSQVTVLKTPTGFLRVRKSASTTSPEVGRVSPGDMLTLLEEKSGWSKVRLSDGKEGFVSSTYVEKKK